MKKMLFVYNPRSGKGLIRTHLSTIIETFSSAGYDVTVYPTKAPMDGCEIVSERAGEFDLIVCSGGDGTLDEVVTGIMRSGTYRTVGYIPAGSTNDFAGSVGIPTRMEQAAKLITDGNPFVCDIGKFNDDYFVYVAGFGMFTDVSYQTKQELKNVLGHIAYILEGIKRVGAWKTCHLRIESDEYTDEGEYIIGLVTNSNSVGGFKGLLGKNVELNDGLFEVTLLKAPQNIVDVQDIISTFIENHEYGNNLVRFKTRRLHITSEQPVAWTRDGENGGEHTDVVLENLHQALRIMTSSAVESEPQAKEDRQTGADGNEFADDRQKRIESILADLICVLSAQGDTVMM